MSPSPPPPSFLAYNPLPSNRSQSVKPNQPVRFSSRGYPKNGWRGGDRFWEALGALVLVYLDVEDGDGYVCMYGGLVGKEVG